MTEYRVSCLPLDHPDADAFALRVAWRGRGKWAVTRFNDCYNRAGERSYERPPSSREDEWLAEHRFDLDTAMEIAIQVAPTLTINTYPIDDVLTLDHE